MADNCNFIRFLVINTCTSVHACIFVAKALLLWNQKRHSASDEWTW